MSSEKVQQSLEKVKAAQKAMCVEVGKAYPMGTIVLVTLGGHTVKLKVVRIPDVYWSPDGQMMGVNLETGKRRKFFDSDVIMVVQ